MTCWTLATTGSTFDYGVVDAMTILLREGVEALLVIVALMAFLQKQGYPHYRKWIGVGAGLGLLFSLGLAVGIRELFATLMTPANQELIEGIVGLGAAGLLLYVSFWLHTQASTQHWKGFLQDQVSNSLAQGGVFSLALLALLAVLREGVETVVFFIGIAPSISVQDLSLGLALGSVILGIMAIVLLSIGIKLPLRSFFLTTSLLIYCLGFKFMGNGLHALQEAGILPEHGATFLPSWRMLGLYNTWETTLAQGGVIITGLLVVFYTRWTLSRPSS